MKVGMDNISNEGLLSNVKRWVKEKIGEMALGPSNYANDIDVKLLLEKLDDLTKHKVDYTKGSEPIKSAKLAKFFESDQIKGDVKKNLIDVINRGAVFDKLIPCIQEIKKITAKSGDEYMAKVLAVLRKYLTTESTAPANLAQRFTGGKQLSFTKPLPFNVVVTTGIMPVDWVDTITKGLYTASCQYSEVETSVDTVTPFKGDFDIFRLLDKGLNSVWECTSILDGNDKSEVLTTMFYNYIGEGVPGLSKQDRDFLEENVYWTVVEAWEKYAAGYITSMRYIIEWLTRSYNRVSNESFQLSIEDDNESISESEKLVSESSDEGNSGDGSADSEPNQGTTGSDSQGSSEPSSQDSSSGSSGVNASSDSESDRSQRESGEGSAEGSREGERSIGESQQEDREEIKLDNPNEDLVRIKQFLEPLLGDATSEIHVLTANEVGRPLYHISMNPNIKSFIPQVSKRTINKEDRSIPRISTATSLIGCFNGYQSMVSDMEGRGTKNFKGLFRVYELPYQYALKPSAKLLADVELSDEYWLISYKKETYNTIPGVVADFTIPKIETVYGSDGKDDTFYIYIRVLNNGLYLDHERVLEKGWYEVVVKGYNFKYPLKGNQDNIRVTPISETDYNRVTALSMMIKTK